MEDQEPFLRAKLRHKFARASDVVSVLGISVFKYFLLVAAVAADPEEQWPDALRCVRRPAQPSPAQALEGQQSRQDKPNIVVWTPLKVAQAWESPLQVYYIIKALSEWATSGLEEKKMSLTLVFNVFRWKSY